MKTILAIGLLVVFAFIANFLGVFLLNIAGFPGALIAGRPGTRSKAQFTVGAIISSLGQSFVYLAYTAFVVNWAMLATAHQGVSIVTWPCAFLAVLLPLWSNLIRARVENREQREANPQVEGLHITLLLTLFGFFLFAFFPVIMTRIYNWVPYVLPLK